MCLLIPISTNNGRHAVHLLYGWIGKVCGGLFIPKVMTEMRQILGERADLLLAVFGKLLRIMFLKNSISFVADGEAATYDRTERSVVCRDANHECSMVNEVDIDFRIPGLPHSVVKQAHNYRVREIEEDREPLSPTVSSTRSTTK